jgi:hypothetical protein
MLGLPSINPRQLRKKSRRASQRAAEPFITTTCTPDDRPKHVVTITRRRENINRRCIQTAKECNANSDPPWEAGAQMVTCPAFVEHEVLCSQQSAGTPYPKNPVHIFALYISEIRFNSITSFTHRLPSILFSWSFPSKLFSCILHCYKPRPSRPPWYVHPNIMWRVKVTKFHLCNFLLFFRI